MTIKLDAIHIDMSSPVSDADVSTQAEPHGNTPARASSPRRDVGLGRAAIGRWLGHAWLSRRLAHSATRRDARVLQGLVDHPQQGWNSVGLLQERPIPVSRGHNLPRMRAQDDERYPRFVETIENRKSQFRAEIEIEDGQVRRLIAHQVEGPRAGPRRSHDPESGVSQYHFHIHREQRFVFNHEDAATQLIRHFPSRPTLAIYFASGGIVIWTSIPSGA